MDYTTYLIVVGVTLAQVRHVLGVNRYSAQPRLDPHHNFDGRYGAQQLPRRDSDYDNDGNFRQGLSNIDDPKRVEQSITSNRQRLVAGNSYVTESVHVALISEKVGSSNNIGNGENESRLRTNAYPTKNIENTEFTTESINKPSQRPHKRTEDQKLSQHFGESSVISVENSSILIKDRLKLQSSSHPHISKAEPIAKDHHFRNGYRQGQFTSTVNPQIAKNARMLNHNESSNTYTKVNNDYSHKIKQLTLTSGKNSGYTEENTTLIQKHNVNTIDKTFINATGDRKNTTDRTKSGDSKGRGSKEKDTTEEAPWVWSSDPDSKVNTTDDDLDNRAAFDGSSCASGFVKVMNICVEKH